MSPNESNLLIDHLDETLAGTELNAVQDLITNNEAAAEEWRLLQFTAANIKEAGLYTQVTAVRDQYNASKKNSNGQRHSGGIVRSMTQTMMRVAAVLVLVSLSAFLYKYISVDNQDVYNKYYGSYELSTTRSANNDNALDNAFQEKEWAEIIILVNGTKDKTSKHLFLSGIAYLELKQYSKAISAFESVKNKNSSSGDDYFGDEADYYLAMSYLANDEGNKALPVLENIKKDKRHIFYSVVNNMGIDFQILKLKNGK